MTNKKDASFASLSSASTLNNTLRKFNQKFPTTEDCYQYIYDYLKKLKQTGCKFCGTQLIQRQYGDRQLTCPSCKRVISITKGTFFERTKKIRDWFKVLWLIESGQNVNSTLISKVANLSYSSSWELFHKFALLISENIDHSSAQVSGLLFSRIICRRSTETPARVAPIEEYDYIEQVDSQRDESEQKCNALEQPETAENRNVSINDKEESLILEMLTSEPVSFDLICSTTNLPAKKVTSALAILELEQVINTIDGNRYSKRTNKIASNTNSSHKYSKLNASMEILNYAESVTEYVKSVFKGISLKYLQNYLAVFWYHSSNRRLNNSDLFGVCINATSHSYKEILSCRSLATLKTFALNQILF